MRKGYRLGITGYSQKGFTLPEVITVTLVAVIVGTLILGIMIQNTRLFVQESEKVTQGLGLNDGLTKIRGSIKEAKAVASGYPEGTPQYASGTTELVLKIPSLDSAGNIIDNTFDFAVFTKSADKLYFKLFPHPSSSRTSEDQILTKSVDSLNFKYFDTSGNEVPPTSAVKARVTIGLKQSIGLDTQTSAATSEANLRND